MLSCRYHSITRHVFHAFHHLFRFVVPVADVGSLPKLAAFTPKSHCTNLPFEEIERFSKKEQKQNKKMPRLKFCLPEVNFSWSLLPHRTPERHPGRGYIFPAGESKAAKSRAWRDAGAPGREALPGGPGGIGARGEHAQPRQAHGWGRTHQQITAGAGQCHQLSQYDSLNSSVWF